MSNPKQSIEDATDSPDEPIWLSNKKPKKIRARAPKAAQQSACSTPTSQTLIPLPSSSGISDNAFGEPLPILVYNLDQSTSHDQTRLTAYELSLASSTPVLDPPILTNKDNCSFWINEIEPQSSNPVPEPKKPSGVAKATKIRKRRVCKVCCSKSRVQIS
jgi:hypothetical protein